MQLILKISKYLKLQVVKILEHIGKFETMSQNQTLEESVKLEDEVLHIFGIKRQVLSKAIIEFSLEEEF
jgi:hypothetical protein